MAEFKRVKRGTNKDYQEERAWAYARSDMQMDLSQYGSAEEVEQAIRDWFGGQPGSGEEGIGGFGSFGEEGRKLVIDLAIREWGEFGPPPVALPPEVPPGLEEAVPTPPPVPPRIPTVREPAVAPEAIPTIEVPPTRVPEVIVPEEEEIPVIETPGQRMSRVVREISSGITESASYQRTRDVAVSAGARVRDAVSDVVNRIRRLLG